MSLEPGWSTRDWDPEPEPWIPPERWHVVIDDTIRPWRSASDFTLDITPNLTEFNRAIERAIMNPTTRRYDNGGANEGDLVELTKGETLVRGRLKPSQRAAHTGRLYIDADAAAKFIDALIEDGWALRIIERALPSLPTTPGLYTTAPADPAYGYVVERRSVAIGTANRWAVVFINNGNNVEFVDDDRLRRIIGPSTALTPLTAKTLTTTA